MILNCSRIDCRNHILDQMRQNQIFGLFCTLFIIPGLLKGQGTYQLGGYDKPEGGNTGQWYTEEIEGSYIVFQTSIPVDPAVVGKGLFFT